MEKIWRYGIFGAVAGALSPWVLKTISLILSKIPAVQVDLQSIAISGKVSGAIGGADLAKQLMGYLPFELTTNSFLITAIGGALFMMLGFLIYDNVKIFQFAKSKTGKLATIMVLAGIASGLMMNFSLGIFSLSIIITMIIDALVLSWIWVLLTKKSKIELIP